MQTLFFYFLQMRLFGVRQKIVCVDSQLIHFEAIRIHGVDLDGYVIFHMAKELYSGKEHITISELSDPELINDKLLRPIVNSFLVRLYGINILLIEGSSGTKPEQQFQLSSVPKRH